ncbi:hypothetical protein ABC955_14960 [Citromicrobium bathyomarinum]
MQFSTSLYEAKLDEIVANANLLANLRPLAAKHQSLISGSLYSLGEEGVNEASAFNRVMESAKLDIASGLQGLVLQAAGVLEQFLYDIVVRYVSEASAKADHWSANDREHVIQTFILKGAMILTHEPTGTFKGADFDFIQLRRNLAITLSDNSNAKMSGDVFVTRFGTCMPEKIERLFSEIHVPGPFDPALGKHPAVKAYTKDSTPTSSARQVRSELDNLGRLRNRLAHGIGTAGVTHNFTTNTAELVRAFTLGVTDRFVVGS